MFLYVIADSVTWNLGLIVIDSIQTGLLLSMLTLYGAKDVLFL